MKLCLATNNAHKISEIQALLDDSFEILSLQDIGCHTELPENQDTLEGNSLEKAMFIWQHYQISCFADDSGLEVEALHGQPGVITAHYSGTRDADANMDLLLQNLAPFTNRNARFRTVITLILNGEVHQFEGFANGSITTDKRGNQGFGYDPIFVPEGYKTTFAEMSIEEKNPISHRGRAITKLIDFLREI